jgi:RHS repeat-associated protein
MPSFSGHSFCAAVVGVIALMSMRPIAADEEPLLPPVAASSGEGGEFFDQVDPRSGAMTYAYRFELPAARGITGPGLSLQYDSSTRDRDAGYGWGLDLPSIELRPLAGLARFAGDGSGVPLPIGRERYAFQGQPLIKICDVGGGCTAEPSTQGHPSWAAGWTYYRLQVEGLFARFYLSSDRRTWRVQFKGGEIVEFGKPIGETYGMPEALEQKGLGIVRWHPVIRRDLQHPNNVVIYRWQPLGARGILYLTDIYDTPSLDSPTALSAFAHHTQLNWNGITYLAGNHQSPERARPDFRLVRVAVASKTWSASGPREIYRAYSLDYYADRTAAVYDSTTQAPLWHHAFLRQIRLNGHCGKTENDDGSIGPNLDCDLRGSMPPVQFEYAPGPAGLFASSLSPVEAGPPDAASNFSVLPYPSSAVIVDFDRDGLPDVVQSWQAPKCNFTRAVAVRDSGAGGGPELYCLRGLSSDGSEFGGYDFSMHSARPILGYQNRGRTGNAPGTFRYECMDAGALSDDLSIVQLSAGSAHDQRNHIAQFLNAEANTVLGAFGSGLGIWGKNMYLPFFARSLTQPTFSPGAEPPNFALGGCHLDGQFDSSAFFPRWRWESRGVEAWSYPVPRIMHGNPAPEWFVDVDGDGYPDVLERFEDGTGPRDFHDARVRFTRKYGVGESVPQAQQAQVVPGPGLVPFVDDVSGPVNSLIPIPGVWDPAPNGRQTQVFYADVNGDGLPDLVTSNRTESGGTLRIRSGDGTGRFSCGVGDPSTCVQEYADAERPDNSTYYYEATIASPTKPWIHDPLPPNGTQPTTFFFLHDVTGDGLADIIRVGAKGPGVVEVWVNLDGQTFACLGPGGDCAVGAIYDTAHGRPIGGASDDYRVAFADMNADGVDDVVVLAKQGIFYGSFFPPAPLSAARGTRPGLLTRIRNGRGATTEIQYRSIQELDVEASTNNRPWQHHSPIVEAVVTQVLTQDTATADGKPGPGSPYSLARRVRYAYSEPAYDSWQRKLVGFRKVSAQVGDEAAITETTYWFGPCESSAPPSRDENGANSTNFCEYGSDDDFAAHPTFKSWVGRPVRIDRYIPANRGQGVPSQRLWTRYLEYEQPIALLSPPNERHVTFTYAKRIETHLYRPDQAVSPGSVFVPLAGGDRVELPPVQVGSKLIEQSSRLDTNGTVIEQRDVGEAAEGDWPRVTQVSDAPFGTPPTVTCDKNWRCLPTYVSTAEEYRGLLVPHRMTRLTYDAGTRDLKLVEGYLDVDHFLYRRHDSGEPFSNGPSGMAAAGWKWLGHYDYTPEGFVALAIGPGTNTTASRACTRFVPDEAYGQFPREVLNFKDGCDSAASLETNLAFDRGFGVAVSVTAPDRAVTSTVLDPFGRPRDIFEPSPDHPSPALALTAHIIYGDSAPLSYVDVTRFTAGGGGGPIRSVQLLNGLLEPVMQLDQGDGAQWIISGWTERDSAGRAGTKHRAFPAPNTTDPTLIAGTAPYISPSGGGYFALAYDGFGRATGVYEDGTQVLQRSYEPLAVVLRDAEQITPGGGAHIGASTRIEYTTRGQIRRTIRRTIADGDHTTKTVFDVLGLPTAVYQSSSTEGGAYSRYLTWDSLGRLRTNNEPNAVDAVSARGWVYAWDDNNRLVGTSDGLGCGKDIYYDSLGRVVGEDFSPCRASQAPYTKADPSTGLNFEVLNTYDNYEAGQIEADATFADDPVLAMGRLVSVRDRGAHTCYSYDNRGRVRRVGRQVAKPVSQQAMGIDPYAPHWYKTRSDFDNADRLTFRTTGADEGPFAAGAGSAESYLYSSRGLLQAVSSAQHGPVIDNITYEPDGLVAQTRYGDIALTKAQFVYGARRRLSSYTVNRVAPALWTTPSANYSQPTIDTTQVMLANFTYAYDLIGNPKEIEDTAPASDWREEVWPQRMRSVGYDDLYRVTSVTYGYNTPSGGAAFRSPFRTENNAGDTRPVPLQTQLPSRIRSEAFTYDFLGNITSSTDDLNATYDRSLGAITNGYGTGWGPNQLTAGNGVRARYDFAGNLVELKVERAGVCPSGTGNKCAQWFAYDWDEIGQLARARRWDYNAALPVLVPGNLPEEVPAWDLHYAYSSGARVVKSATDSLGVERHTFEVFETLRFDHDEFIVASGDYERHRDHTHVYLAGGVGHQFFDGGTLPRPPSTHETRLFLNIGDHLGSAIVTIDHTTSEVVERATFHSHGAIESDYRPDRWHNAREPYKFTGKEEDIEVGATYFGARYYQPYLGRYLSADPLTIHRLGGNLNPYAYVDGRVMSQIDPRGLQSEPVEPVEPVEPPDPPPNPIPPDDGTWIMGPRVPFLWSLGQRDSGGTRAQPSIDRSNMLAGILGTSSGTTTPSSSVEPEEHATTAGQRSALEGLAAATVIHPNWVKIFNLVRAFLAYETVNLESRPFTTPEQKVGIEEMLKRAPQGGSTTISGSPPPPPGGGVSGGLIQQIGGFFTVVGSRLVTFLPPVPKQIWEMGRPNTTDY